MAASEILTQSCDCTGPLFPPLCQQWTWSISILATPLFSLCTVYGFVHFFISCLVGEVSAVSSSVNIGLMFLTGAGISRAAWSGCVARPAFVLPILLTLKTPPWVDSWVCLVYCSQPVPWGQFLTAHINPYQMSLVVDNHLLRCLSSMVT